MAEHKNRQKPEVGAAAAVDDLADHAVKSGKLEERPFRFFDLARELRNKIYSKVTQDFELTCHSLWGYYPDHIEVIAKAFCSPNPRLVNHDFETEYEEEVLRCAEVEVRRDVKKYGTDVEQMVETLLSKEPLS
ncbi:hypothetical protein LTR65_003711 [Meristemomyces frigidus]